MPDNLYRYSFETIKGPTIYRASFNKGPLCVLLASVAGMVMLAGVGGYVGSRSDAEKTGRGYPEVKRTPCPDDLKAAFSKQMAPENGEKYALASAPVTIITKTPDGKECALKLP